MVRLARGIVGGGGIEEGVGNGLDDSRATDGFHLGGIDPAVGDTAGDSALAIDVLRFGTRKGGVEPNNASSLLIAALEAALRSLVNPCLPGEADMGGEELNDEGDPKGDGEVGLIGDLVEFWKDVTLLSLCGIDRGDGGCGERLFNVGGDATAATWSNDGVGDELGTDNGALPTKVDGVVMVEGGAWTLPNSGF